MHVGNVPCMHACTHVRMPIVCLVRLPGYALPVDLAPLVRGGRGDGAHAMMLHMHISRQLCSRCILGIEQ